MSQELGEDVAAETEVELWPPLGTGRLPKPGHDRFMSGARPWLGRLSTGRTQVSPVGKPLHNFPDNRETDPTGDMFD